MSLSRPASWFRPALLPADRLLARENVYELDADRPPALPPLHEDLRVDTLVVGGGLAGIGAALTLAQGGQRVALLEADRLCGGASGRNGGQTIVGVACGQGTLESVLGPEGARTVWQLSLEALATVDRNIAVHKIACDRRHGYLYVADTARQAQRLQAETEHLNRHYGLVHTWHTGDGLHAHIGSDRYVAGAHETRSGHLHPLRYGLGLARAAREAGALLYEGSPVQRLTREHGHWRAHTGHAAVDAEWVVLAGNCTLPEWGPRLAPRLAPRIMPVGTYIGATPVLGEDLCRRLLPTAAAVCDNNVALDYFRCSADHRLLFGGRVSYTTRTPQRLRDRMQARMAAIFPALRETPLPHLWGGFVDISRNRAPDFGRLHPTCYYLQGFSGHGLALSGYAGHLVARAIQGQAGRFDLLARIPHRDFPGGPALRTPLLALGMLGLRLREWLD